MREIELERAAVSVCPGGSDHLVVMPAPLFLRFLDEASRSHASGLKSFGLFLARSSTEPARPVDVFFCDPKKNRRNDREHRPGFEAQGAYFRRHHDAGFVADAREVLSMERTARALGLCPVGLFHSHRRQPANFSLVDYRLHNPFFGWHLVISMRDPERPVALVFSVDKPFDDHGLDSEVVVEDEGELPYRGPEVQQGDLVLQGRSEEIDRSLRTIEHNTFFTAAAGARSRHERRGLASFL